jgi:succinate dehydrogenase / fumarate reductase cytochrome b subunit
MGISGALLISFLVVHMLGNLQIFLGPDAINDYAAFLKSIPGPLWGARIGLIAIFIVHVVTALQLKALNISARTESYVFENTVQASKSSRFMALSGTIILFYVIGHLLHFTLGVIHPEYFSLVDQKGRHDVYAMIVKSFQHTPLSLLYIFAMLTIWSHLSHAIASVFQTFGIRSKQITGILNLASPALATLIVVGYIIVPLAVLVGILQV